MSGRGPRGPRGGGRGDGGQAPPGRAHDNGASSQPFGRGGRGDARGGRGDGRGAPHRRLGDDEYSPGPKIFRFVPPVCRYAVSTNMWHDLVPKVKTTQSTKMWSRTKTKMCKRTKIYL